MESTIIGVGRREVGTYKEEGRKREGGGASPSALASLLYDRMFLYVNPRGSYRQEIQTHALQWVLYTPLARLARAHVFKLIYLGCLIW
jgi:hypothetical protein